MPGVRRAVHGAPGSQDAMPHAWAKGNERMLTDREFLLSVRQALLMIVDTIERLCNISPRTSELRKESKMN